jgi:hypothetical protein
MGQLEQVQFMKTPRLDKDKAIESIIELREKHGVEEPIRRILGNLVDQSVSEKPFYAVMEDEDLVYWPQYLLFPVQN